MGTKFEGATNADLLRFSPEAIGSIIRPANLSRAQTESEESIRAFAERIASMGQHTPVTIRRDNEGRPVLVAGNRRIRAISLINEDPGAFMDSQGKPLAGPLPLTARFIKMSEDQAVAYHLSENVDRLEPSVIDLANAARTLSEVHAWQQERIGKAMNCSASRVSQLLGLLELPARVLRRLEEGTIREATAKALRGVSAELVDEHLAALDRGEKPAKVARAARESIGKRTKLTVPEILSLLDTEDGDQAAALAAWIRCEGDLEAAKLGDFPAPDVGTVGGEPAKTFICLDCLHEQAPRHEGCEECGSDRVTGKSAVLKALESREVAP